MMIILTSILFFIIGLIWGVGLDMGIKNKIKCVGKLDNGENIFVDKTGDILIEKDHSRLVEATLQNLKKLF